MKSDRNFTWITGIFIILYLNKFLKGSQKLKLEHPIGAFCLIQIMAHLLHP